MTKEGDSMDNQLKFSISAVAEALREPATHLITKTFKVIGTERANAILAQTLEIHANGGMPRLDGQGMRTLGGIYLYLVKEQCSRQERYRIFGSGPTGTPQAPVPPCTWQDVQEAISELANTGAEATMKLTLIGRPLAVQTKGSTKIFQLTGKAPASLPKELPPIPKSPPLTWTVIVGLRQWNKVKDSLAQHPDDRLIIDGFPVLQGDQHILLATNCQSVKAQQARKADQRAESTAQGTTGT
jgi:hypothetical protein